MLPTNDNNVTIENLEYFSTYLVSVQAVRGGGNGEMVSTMAQTKETGEFDTFHVAGVSRRQVHTITKRKCLNN